MMKSIGKIFLGAVILFAGVYWAASNPLTARDVKKTADRAFSETKDALTD
jgi:hypothetical protein